MRGIDGGLLILGAGGKMGPSLARLAQRASREASVERRIVAVARFTDPGLEAALHAYGIETIRCDLFDAGQVQALPDLPNIVFMAGQKFGTSDDAPRTWAVNAYLPGVVATRFPASRIVAYSTGNVYPLSGREGEGPVESDPTGPIGEYAQSALARERVLEFFSRSQPTPMAILRLNYAIEPRYGVLRDIADKVASRQPIDLSMGRVNVIWQRDANAIALRALQHCAVPPMVLNVTGRPAHPVRWLAGELGRRLGIEPVFRGVEAESALLSDATRCEELFGLPPVGIDEMLDCVASWVAQGGRSLGRPTHYESREGRF